MENISIIIPIESNDEEKTLKSFVRECGTAEVTIGDEKNIDGETLATICGQVDHLITIAGSLASLYAVFANKRVVISDKVNKIKKNIKLKDIPELLKKMPK